MIGLDPVKLEPGYLVLYSMYAAHMGQGKETAQVAMKYTILDLQKDAVAKNTSLITSGFDSYCKYSKP